VMSSWSIAERHPIGRMCRADPSHTTYRSPLPTLQPNVGTGAGEVPETLRTEWDRRLELPFSFIVAA
jgi:hypothetical protein